MNDAPKTTLEKLATPGELLTPGQRVTLYLMLAAGAGLAAYDFWAAMRDDGSNDTESWVVKTVSEKYPAVPFGFGFLCGHLFASQHARPQ